MKPPLLTGLIAYIACCGLVAGAYAFQPGAWIVLPLCLAFPIVVLALPAKSNPGRRRGQPREERGD